MIRKLKRQTQKKNICRKGQVQTQVFIYIIALVVIALVLIYGYSSIRSFIHSSDDVNYMQFQTDFTNTVDSMSHEYESVIKKEIKLPRMYTEMIVIDLTKTANASFGDIYPVVFDSWGANVTRNVFLVGDNNNVVGFSAGKVVVGENKDHVIVNAPDNVLKLRLTGVGGATRVEPW
jgi:hypothetical protein